MRGEEAVVAGVLTELLGRRVKQVTMSRSRYSTSAPIDDVTATLDDDSIVRLVRKDVAMSSRLPEARRAKPDFLRDPSRELLAYRDVMPMAPAGPPRCVGIVDEPRRGRQWLFLERLDGVELFQVGDVGRWRAAARWAARFHRTFEGRGDELRRAGVPLLTHDGAWWRRWLDRLPAGTGPLRAVVEPLTDRLADLATTVVHGELYASNVIVGPPARSTRVSPIDWETIAEGCGLIDLAALTAGPWPPAERQSIERAYADELGRPSGSDFAADLDACRLAMCVQWLGWAPDWRPPAEHRWDWHAEALRLVERLRG